MAAEAKWVMMAFATAPSSASSTSPWAVQSDKNLEAVTAYKLSSQNSQPPVNTLADLRSSQSAPLLPLHDSANPVSPCYDEGDRAPKAATMRLLGPSQRAFQRR